MWADDCLVAVAVAKAQPPQDEYETDSEDDFSNTKGEDFAPITVSRSGRPIRACFRLDLKGTLTKVNFEIKTLSIFACWSVPHRRLLARV